MVFIIIISILIVGCIYSFRHPYQKQSQKKSDQKPSTSVARKKPLPQDMLPVADSIIDAGPASGEALVRFSWNVSCYLHDDIRGMIWFADGPFQNYQPEQDHYVLFEYYGYRFYLGIPGEEEPSAIHMYEKIILRQDTSSIPRPPYYPRYITLTPEQRGVYLRLLENPYNTDIDIGYVFILYYGLERHLFCGNWQRAYYVISKLRKVHKNKSFQMYSGNAIILSSILRRHGEMAMDFIKSLSFEHELLFSQDLYLLCLYSFPELKLTASDIIRMASLFEFNNRLYIKKYPDLFCEVLRQGLVRHYGTDSIVLQDIIKKSDVKRLPLKDLNIFANMSLRRQTVPVPSLSDCFSFKKDMNMLLEATHEAVKAGLAERRKHTRNRRLEQK